MSKFQPSITNEAINELPPVKFPGEIVIVDKPEQVAQACAEIARYDVVGFDTETRPNFKPGPMNNVALVQVATPDRCYLFRLSHLNFDKTLVRLIENRSVLKIGAGLDNDIQALRKIKRFRADSLTDLQNLVQEWGIEDKSLRKLAAIILGSRVSKAQRLSNWEAVELTPAQKMYAATDAWVCLKIYQTLLEHERCR